MLVTITVFNSLVEAKIAAALLQDHGIEGFVFDEQMGSFYTIAVGGFRLQVSDQDLEQAKTILANAHLLKE